MFRVVGRSSVLLVVVACLGGCGRGAAVPDRPAMVEDGVHRYTRVYGVDPDCVRVHVETLSDDDLLVLSNAERGIPARGAVLSIEQAAVRSAVEECPKE